MEYTINNVTEEENFMSNNIGNYTRHAEFWDWSGYDRTAEHEYWYNYAAQYGKNVLIPFCAWGETGAYMAERGMNVTAFDLTPEMIAEGKKRFGDLKNLHLFEGDVTDFRFDIPPVDFCYAVDFGHILSIDNIKKALQKINNHLRYGGCMVIEAGLPAKETSYTPPKTFFPISNPYPDKKVWKTGDGRTEAQTGRHYISQTIYIENKDGSVEQFEHSFYLQSYSREEWLSALHECGFEVKYEYRNREKELWQEGEGFWICEAVKSNIAKQRYCPAVSFDYLQTPIYRYENVALYNDTINLQQPNDGYLTDYRFDINADGEWVGWIKVKIGYSITAYYDGQIGYEIYNEQHRNRSYATKACLALMPFLQKCGFHHVLITTDENNAPSRRVCEKIGTKLLEIVDTPTWTGIYRNGQRRTCIYEWEIEEKEV